MDDLCFKGLNAAFISYRHLPLDLEAAAEGWPTVFCQCEAMQPYGIDIAYDGMIAEI